MRRWIPVAVFLAALGYAGMKVAVATAARLARPGHKIAAGRT